jgi:hypothetical protein
MIWLQPNHLFRSQIARVAQIPYLSRIFTMLADVESGGLNQLMRPQKAKASSNTVYSFFYCVSHMPLF